jgi:hypothetical protein
LSYFIELRVRRRCLLHLLMDYININISVLIVACFSLLAVISHVFGGTKETASIAPDKNNILLTRSWKLAMCALQMLALDLIAVTIALFTISLTDLLSFE